MKIKRKLKLLIASIALAALVLSVMYMLSEGQKVEVKNLIKAYNSLITKAHFELNAGPVYTMTSEWQWKKIDSYIASNLKKGRTIKGDLIELEFKEVTIDKDLATVITQERWLWGYVDPASKEPVSEFFDELYGITYHLIKIENRWVIDDIANEFIGKATE
ncbi:MAG: hypothetical protein JSV11_11020 [Nitrospiraceae bacterium]|nr:MAG: hypothetical protein JSV11_11020 [Nitrospiraceae bacterium]